MVWLCTSTSGDSGSIPAWESKIQSCLTWPKRKKRRRKKYLGHPGRRSRHKKRKSCWLHTSFILHSTAREQWNSIWGHFFFPHKPFLRINQLEFSQEIIGQISEKYCSWAENIFNSELRLLESRHKADAIKCRHNTTWQCRNNTSKEKVIGEWRRKRENRMNLLVALSVITKRSKYMV